VVSETMFPQHHIANSYAEGINSVIQEIKTGARGVRNFKNYRNAILFFCGGLELYPYLPITNPEEPFLLYTLWAIIPQNPGQDPIYRTYLQKNCKEKLCFNSLLPAWLKPAV